MNIFKCEVWEIMFDLRGILARFSHNAHALQCRCPEIVIRDLSHRSFITLSV